MRVILSMKPIQAMKRSIVVKKLHTKPGEMFQKQVYPLSYSEGEA